MADHYQKALESERKSLWAFCRLRGLARDTPERQRIEQIDAALKAHLEKKGPANAAETPRAKPKKVAAKKAAVDKSGTEKA